MIVSLRGTYRGTRQDIWCVSVLRRGMIGQSRHVSAALPDLNDFHHFQVYEADNLLNFFQPRLPQTGGAEELDIGEYFAAFGLPHPPNT